MSSQQLEFGSPSDADDYRRSLLVLIAEDVRNGPHVRAVASAILTNIEPGQPFSANDVRPYLPPWIKRSAVGPTFGLLCRRGALRPVGQVTSTGKSAHGKPLASYVRAVS